jgi:hypothetical protein
MTSNLLRTWLAALVAVGASSLIAGCAPQPGQAPAAAAAVTSPVSINAEMVRVVDHAAHRLWDVEKDGMAPRTDADWEIIEEHATQVAASGVLIRLEGAGVNDRTFVRETDWQRWAIGLSDAGLAAFKAAENRNLKALVAANGQLVETCEGCHRRFKPAIPSEGITHSHVD